MSKDIFTRDLTWPETFFAVVAIFVSIVLICGVPSFSDRTEEAINLMLGHFGYALGVFFPGVLIGVVLAVYKYFRRSSTVKPRSSFVSLSIVVLVVALFGEFSEDLANIFWHNN